MSTTITYLDWVRDLDAWGGPTTGAYTPRPALTRG